MSCGDGERIRRTGGGDLKEAVETAYEVQREMGKEPEREGDGEGEKRELAR